MATSQSPDRKRVGPYTIIERLGEGGMGVVYRGKSKDHEAAVKVIRESMLEREDIRTRFTREIETLQAIESPHVARILGSDMSKKTAWIATEFVEGRSLKEFVDTDGPLDEPTWVAVAEGLLEGLVAIHEAGVIHQDMKPANIMMSAEGPKIIDFGISREIGATRVTMTGMFAGSAGWMAPERAELDIETTASDVFSVGLVLAFAALGKHPWDGETTQSDVAITLSMLSKSPNLELLTRRQRELVEGMLNMDSDKRPSAVRALGILRGAIKPEKAPAKPNRRVVQKKRWGLVRRETPVLTLGSSAIGGALLALGAVGVTFLAGYAVSAGTGFDRAMRSLEVAAWLLGDALGFELSALSFDWILGAESQVTSTLGFRPLLLTIVLLFVVFRFARRMTAALAGSKRVNLVAHIVFFSTPLLVAITGLRILSAESLVFRGSNISVAAWTIFDFAFALGLVSITAAAGVLLGSQNLASSAVGWVYIALKQGAGFFMIVLAGLLTSLAIYTAIAPTFLNSIDVATAVRPFLGYGVQDYLVLYLFALAFFPAMLVGYLSLVVAGRAGIYIQRDDSLILEVLQPSAAYVPSAWEALFPGDYLFGSLFVLFLAISGMISGASVLNQTGIGPTNARGMLKVALVTTSLVVLLAAVTSSAVFAGKGSWTPAVLFYASGAELYVSLLAAFIVGLVLSASIIAGSRPVLWQFIVRALPRTIVGTRAVREETNRKIFVIPRLAGIVLLSLISVVFIAPVGIASAERVLASEATPEQTASQWADDFESGAVSELSGLFSESLESHLTWLPSSVIDEARPSPRASRNLTVRNLSGALWKAGELDAVAKLQWSGEGGDVSWDVPVGGDVKRIWRYVRSVEYTADVVPVVVTFGQQTVADEALNSLPVRVNGENVNPGSYLSVPGTYSFARDGIGFLAPFSSVASSSADELLLIAVPADLALPEGATSMLEQHIDKLQEACGGLRSSRCIEFDDISRYMVLESGWVPGKFFSSSETGYIRGNVRCAPGDSKLLGLFEIAHVADCIQVVTSEETYYDSRQIAEPVYSTRCARYSYSWWWGLYCAQYENYQSSTNYRTVVGSPISTVRHRSEVPFSIHVNAGLEEDGTFTVNNAEVQ